MSVEDETELKDLLLQTLTENGSLAKIKAQLRASVFLALEEDINLSSQKPLLNEKVKSSLKSSEGQLMFCIVKEFLEYFNLQSTMAVFNAESYLGISYNYEGKKKLSAQLGLSLENENNPLLQQLVQLAQQKSRVLEVNLNINRENSEIIDNETGSLNSIQTETSISDSSEVKNSDNKNTSVHNNKGEISDPSLEYKYENDLNDRLNETYTTESRYTLNNSDASITINGDVEENLSDNLSNEFTQKPVLSSAERYEEMTAPILKDIKISPEKVKSPPKCEKFKSKNKLNSLSDLPPLNMNKSLTGKILPSLYNKEFHEKPNS